MAVIGQGHFAQAAVLPAIEQLPEVQLAALVSGSHHKLDELAVELIRGGEIGDPQIQVAPHEVPPLVDVEQPTK